MQKPERSGYSVLDFQSWRANKQLSISPRFQRRKVWGDPAKSYLVDTILLGYPIPPIYIRIVKEKGSKLPVREVIDGQQRISSVLDFIENKFVLSKNIESPYVGKKFEELPQDERDKIENYNFICEVFQGISDAEVLSIFGRLNTFSVRLNAQELRNGRYFGPFKQSAYALAYNHLTFWRQNRIFTEMGIARMLEVELTSELMIAMLSGMQDKKKSIDGFYKQFDDKFEKRRVIEQNFRKVVDEINVSFPEGLSKSAFRRGPLFYSLFLALYHRLYSLPGARLPSGNARTLSEPERAKFRHVVDHLSNVIAAAKKDVAVPQADQAFVNAATSQTDNIRPREVRFETLYRRAF